MSNENSNQLFKPGQVWSPTVPGKRAKPRTIVWVGPCKYAEPGVTTIGYVEDPANPKFPAPANSKFSGHDSWVQVSAFKAWIKKYNAVCSQPELDHRSDPSPN